MTTGPPDIPRFSRDGAAGEQRRLALARACPRRPRGRGHGPTDAAAASGARCVSRCSRTGGQAGEGASWRLANGAEGPGHHPRQP
eukprot:scaffold26404_cov129-Isochrysis_galbana.AAC.2